VPERRAAVALVVAMACSLVVIVTAGRAAAANIAGMAVFLDNYLSSKAPAG
jgi:hypothetical protein